jgi:hypothetical protein
MHRFVQYNVLSPNLASPSHYERSPPEALDERTRKAKILQKLDAFTRYAHMHLLRTCPTPAPAGSSCI